LEKELAKSYIWAIAYYLIQEKGYKMIHLQESQSPNESSYDASEGKEPENLIVHLIQKNGKELKYIRMALVDFVWSSVVERSVKEIAATAELFRKKFGANKIDGLNLYFFPSTPMADILNRSEQFGKVRIGKTTFLQTICIDMEHGLPLNPIMENGQFDLSNEELIHLLLQDPGSSRELMQELLLLEEKKKDDFRNFFFRAKPILTYIFLAVNLIMFVILTVNGGSTNEETLYQYGAKYSPAIVDRHWWPHLLTGHQSTSVQALVEGEWWRLFTSIFLHIGFLHLAFNSLALYYLGSAVERMYGSYRYGLLYLIAGLMGSIASFAFNHPNVISAGASGAIYGCFGALLYFGVRRRDLFFQTIGRDILIILGINLAMSFSMASIDLFAHLGGLIGGFMAAAMVGLPQFGKEYGIRLVAAILIVSLAVLGWILGVEQVNTWFASQLR